VTYSDEPIVELSRETVGGYMVQGLLRNLAESGDNEALREMAAEVLAGNITLTQAMGSMAYRDTFESIAADINDDPDMLSDEWRARHQDDIDEFEKKAAEENNIILRD
jgi:hypothetical protein